MESIQLTSADLTANRRGVLSKPQRQFLRRQRLFRAAGTVALVLILVALVTVLWFKGRNPAFAGRGQLFLVLPLFLFWLWLLRRQPRQWQQLNRDLAEGRVATTEGVVYGGFRFGLGLVHPTHYRLQVGDQRFAVSAETFHRLRPGERYRLYHTRHARAFLGALPLAGVPQPAERDEPAITLLEPLTPREAEVLRLIASGLSNREIAAQLHLSVNTVKMYASQLYRKLGASRRTEAVARARELNLL